MNIKSILITIGVVLAGALGLLTYKYTNNQVSTTENTNIQEQQPLRVDNGKGNGIGQKNLGLENKAQSRKNCLSDECLTVEDLNYPAGELVKDVKTALQKALDDEYKAQATYETIIAKLGSVRPFIMIIRAEEQHISSLKSLFDKYGLTIPENPYTNKVTSPSNLTEACVAGVEAEISNASLYKNDLLPIVQEYEDITQVFTNLMNASEQKHLPAFQRCAH